jgi:hypothetical protein
MSVLVLDETAQEEIDRTGSLCGQCLRRAALSLVALYDDGEITGNGVVEELRRLTGQ